MITTRAYFALNSDLPFVSDDVPNASLVGNKSEADSLIQRYEKDILQKTLGYSLYKAFMAQFDYSEATNVHTIKESADQKWKDLLTGKKYTLRGVDVVWQGIVFEDEDVKRSFITNYVYCQWLKNDTSKHLGVGLSVPKAKNATRANPAYKFTESYNDFVALVVGKYCNGSSYELGSGVRSMYEFINDMNDLNANTYPNWMPEEFKPVNVFSI